MDETLDKIVQLAKSGKGDEAKQMYIDHMTDIYIWDDNAKLYRRKDAPLQMTYTKEEFDDLLGHNFDRWLISQKKKIESSNQSQSVKSASSSILVMENNKLVDPRQSSLRSQTNDIPKSQSKVASSVKQNAKSNKKNDSDDEFDENRSVIVSTNSKNTTTTSSVKQSQSKFDITPPPAPPSTATKAVTTQSAIKNSNEQVIQHFENSVEAAALSIDESKPKAVSQIKENDSIPRSALKSQRKDDAAVSHVKSNKKEEFQSQIKSMSAMKEPSRSKIIESNEAVVAKSMTKSQKKDENLNNDPPLSSIVDHSQEIKKSQKKEEHTSIPQSASKIAVSNKKADTPFVTASNSKIQSENFAPVSFVKNAIHPPSHAKNVTASSRKLSKAARPDDRSILAFRSLLCPAMGVDPDMFEELKKDHSDYLFIDPLTSNEFLVLRNKRSDNSVVRVFATGEGLTMQQTKFGLKNLYEKKYAMRSFERDVDTLYQIREKSTNNLSNQSTIIN